MQIYHNSIFALSFHPHIKIAWDSCVGSLNIVFSAIYFLELPRAMYIFFIDVIFLPSKSINVL